ncbi:MAG TPA: HAMP domain-containing sensor histidine kinase [Polyangiaceae bacterium]
MNPFRFYFRGRLHRKIFAWFGVSIMATAMVVLFVSASSFSHGGRWGLERARTFVSGQFAEAWDEPARRDALASALARDMDVSVHLRDAGGATIHRFGGFCEHHPMRMQIERSGHLLGQVDICGQSQFRPQFLLPIVVAMTMLWGASGAIARRLVRPLYELSRVAQDIGHGHLKSRVHLSRRHGMEFCMVGNVMNDMASRIEKQLADQRALLATVSHEIRTPLSRMRLLIEFARQKTEENLAKLPQARHALGELEQLEREVTEIDVLVSDLLASSRIDFTAITRSRLDAVEMAKTALERASVDATKLAAPREPLFFEGDPTLVARAVSNLLENAKRHAGGVERLLVQTSPGFVSFIVEDNGPGFEPGEENRVFEPFYKRAAFDAGANGSVGLGLALVKKIAEAHHGRVHASTRRQGGARVAVEFAR